MLSYIKHPYIAQSLKEVDSFFVYKENHFDDFSKLLEDYPKFALHATSSWDKGFEPKFNYLKFDSLINPQIFLSECQDIISLRRDSYFLELDDYIKNQKLEIKIIPTLKQYHNTLVKSSEILSSFLIANKFQCRAIVIKSLVKDYLESQALIEKKYDFILDFNPKEKTKPKVHEDKYKGISKYIFDDEILKLKEIEQKLIDNDFLGLSIDNKFYWKGDKTELVDFVRVLRNSPYPIMRPHIDTTKGFKFFEKRYNIDLGTLRRESKFKSRPLHTISQFDFIFDK